MKRIYGIRRDERNLLLAHRQVARIDVHRFELSEEELTGTGIIGVRASEHDGQLHILKGLESGLGGVVRSIVNDDHRVLLPPLPLLLELLVQVSEENIHDLAVGIGLSQRKVDISKSVKTNDHGNPGDQLDGRN